MSESAQPSRARNARLEAKQDASRMCFAERKLEEVATLRFLSHETPCIGEVTVGLGAARVAART